MNKKIINLSKIIALIEVIIGVILLSKEIITYLNLSNIENISNQFKGIVDLFQYKRYFYKNFFLYSLLIITGLSFWINIRIYWGFTQVLLYNTPQKLDSKLRYKRTKKQYL